MDLASISALKELLTVPEDSDSDDDLPKSSFAKLGPGNIGTVRGTAKPSSSKNPGGDGPADPKSIWDQGEVPTQVICDASLDPRKMPEYDIKFRQRVSPEDIFLQMGNKTPGTASCEEMVVLVQLPGERLQDVDVDVSGSDGKYLDLRSKDHRLHLALPFPVEPGSARAEWVSDKEALRVTLTMRREFDFVNF